MPPKKKANNKGNGDWESELGETVDPTAAATQEAKEADASNEAQVDGAVGGGGLLAALKKNKSKKQKKGKVIEDFVEGEDPPESNGTNGDGANGQTDLAAKAPEEATTDDLYAAPAAKGRGGKGGKQGNLEDKVEDEEDEDEGDGGKIKTKKEKEKEKKEREKQRKKEQVYLDLTSPVMIVRRAADWRSTLFRLRRKRPQRPQQLQSQKLENQSRKRSLSNQDQNPMQPREGKSFPPQSPFFESSKKRCGSNRKSKTE